MLIVMSRDDSYCWFPKASLKSNVPYVPRKYSLSFFSFFFLPTAPWRDKTHTPSHLVFALMYNMYTHFLWGLLSVNWVTEVLRVGIHYERLSLHLKHRKTLLSSGTVKSVRIDCTTWRYLPAWLQLRYVWFRPLCIYTASQLLRITTVGKGGSAKRDGSQIGFFWAGGKSSCLKTIKASMM